MDNKYKNVEWAGAITGMIGSLLISTNTDISKFGFIFYLINNLAFIAFALLAKRRGILMMNLFFLGTAFIGIARWF